MLSKFRLHVNENTNEILKSFDVDIQKQDLFNVLRMLIFPYFFWNINLYKNEIP